MQDQSFKKIILATIWSHLLVIGCLLVGNPSAVKKKPHRPIVVKTVLLAKTPSLQVGSRAERSPSPKTAPSSVKSTPPAPSTKKTISPTKPKPAAPAPTRTEKKQPSAAPTPTRTEKKQPSAAPRNKIPEALIRELEESLSKIEGKKSALPARGANPLPSLQIDLPLEVECSDEDTDYVPLLVACMHEALRLPERGDVKIQLTLRLDGSIVRLVVLQAQSKRNRAYLEEHLPKMHFPPLGRELAKDGEHTFSLLFCGER